LTAADDIVMKEAWKEHKCFQKLEG